MGTDVATRDVNDESKDGMTGCRERVDWFKTYLSLLFYSCPKSGNHKDDRCCIHIVCTQVNVLKPCFLPNSIGIEAPRGVHFS